MSHFTVCAVFGKTSSGDWSAVRPPSATPAARGPLSLNSYQRQLLRDGPVFSELSEPDFERVLRIMRHRDYRTREAIVRQGDVDANVYAILTGHAKVVATGSDGNEAVLGFMKAGEVFGEVSLFDGEVRSASVIALGRCRVGVLERDAFLGLMEASPSIAVGMARVLARRLRRLSERSEDLATLELEYRLAKRVAELARRFGLPMGTEGVQLGVKLSQQELGEYVGGTRESVNKYLRRWSQQGWVRQEGRQLRILDIDALERLAARPPE